MKAETPIEQENTNSHSCDNAAFAPEVPETCTTDGIKAHYKCSCGKLYLDKTALTEVTL